MQNIHNSLFYCRFLASKSTLKGETCPTGFLSATGKRNLKCKEKKTKWQNCRAEWQKKNLLITLKPDLLLKLHGVQQLITDSNTPLIRLDHSYQLDGVAVSCLLSHGPFQEVNKASTASGEYSLDRVPWPCCLCAVAWTTLRVPWPLSLHVLK